MKDGLRVMSIWTERRVFLLWFVCFLALWIVSSAPAAAEGGGENLLLNGDFEQQGTIPAGWSAFEGWTNPELSVSAAGAYSGTAGLRISTALANRNPWVRQIVQIEEKTEYKLAAWMRGAGVQGTGAGFKLEFYKGNAVTSANNLNFDQTFITAPSELTGDWEYYEYGFTAPEEAAWVVVYARLYGTGTLDMDEISFTLERERSRIDLETDSIFYYTGMASGTVKADFYLHQGDPARYRVEATIAPETGGTPVAVSDATYTDQPLTMTFNPGLLVKQQPYRVVVRLLDDSQQEIARETERIFRFDRPSMLREDGTLLVDNEPFFPVMAYHVALRDYPYVVEAGVNVVQGNGTNNREQLQSMLDAALQNGIRLAVPLYYQMKVQENMELIETFVTEFRNHPALFAWMVMDEPALHHKTKEELVEAYRLVRTLDPVHPVYMVEALPGSYSFTEKVTDIFATDVYPIPRNPISIVGERVALAKQLAGEHQPVMNVMQAMYNPPNWPVLTTIEQVRNMIYQSLASGAQGMGYYSFNENGFVLRNSALWPGLVGIRQEIERIGEIVTSMEIADSGQAADMQWRLWQDGGEYYAAVVNTGSTGTEATIPLAGSGYEAVLLYGDTYKETVNTGDSLTVILEPLQALLYRVTPFTTMAGRARSELASLSSWSNDLDWQDAVDRLDETLQELLDELAASPTTVDAVVSAALDGLDGADVLLDWLGVHASGSAESVKKRIEQLRLELGTIAGASAAFMMELNEERIIGQSVVNAVYASVANNGMQALQQVEVSIAFPESFGLMPLEQALPSIGADQQASAVLPFTLTHTPLAADYRLNAAVSFVYADRPGTRVVMQRSAVYPLVDMVDGQLSPSALTMQAGKSYSSTLRLENRVADSLPLSLEAHLPPEWTITLPQQVVIAGHEALNLPFDVHVPSGVTDQVYTAQIRLSSGETLIRSLPLLLEVNHNLLPNPGFEAVNLQGNGPADWTLRQGIWSEDSRSGLYAAALQPDPGNNWNVINSALIPVEDGYRYAWSGWVKNEADQGSVTVGLRESYANGATSIRYIWSSVPYSEDWTFYSGVVEPSPAAQHIQLYLMSDTGTNGTAWFDDGYIRAIPAH